MQVAYNEVYNSKYVKQFNLLISKSHSFNERWGSLWKMLLNLQNIEENSGKNDELIYTQSLITEEILSLLKLKNKIGHKNFVIGKE